MKLNTRHLLQKNDGFTLIELILAIAICSIIMLPIYAILNTSAHMFNSGREKDELFLNGKHSIEYIKNDIKAADIIIPHYKIKKLKEKYPTNIGFVLVIVEEKINPEIPDEFMDIYKYVTYYTKGNKLIRISCEDKLLKYPSKDELQGHNEICRLIDTIENTDLDIENSIVKLDFDFKSSSNEMYTLNMKSDTYIRCEIDY